LATSFCALTGGGLPRYRTKRKEETVKNAGMVARILLGLIFVFFGSNHLWSFLPTGPTPTGAAGQFMSAMTTTHYFFIVGLLEVIPGILLLVRLFVPLALTVLAPIIVNILLVGFLMAPAALPAGLIAALLWCVVFWRVRGAFAGLFKARMAD
jgi:putative oxidoreductase